MGIHYVPKGTDLLRQAGGWKPGVPPCPAGQPCLPNCYSAPVVGLAPSRTAAAMWPKADDGAT